jgi:hypothetical protein
VQLLFNLGVECVAMSNGQNQLYQKTLRFVSSGGRAKSAQQYQRVSIFSAINKIFQSWLAAASSENEVRIWQTCDRYGNTWWHGCDRATGCSTCVATDDEMRAWLDRRYCQ